MTGAPVKRTTRRVRRTREIHVRMYNVGFGDCFLIDLPSDVRRRKVLLDCGYHSQGRGAFDDRSLVKQVKEDLRGESIDVVIASHRHQDHISGFGEEDLWKDIGVEEVWLPFTAREDAHDGDRSLAAWERVRAGVSGLVEPSGTLRPEVRRCLSARRGDTAELEFLLWNARQNAPGIHNLLHGMRRADGKRSLRRFLPEGKKDVPYTFESEALPDVKVHVLGPSRDPAYRSKRKVPASWAALGDTVSFDTLAEPPFGREWQVKNLPPKLPLSSRDLAMIRTFNADLFDVASAVDGFLNGESLVLVLEIGHARLLLPGDAEVSSWMKILEDPDATALASSATFLKVGHHGSHNATPLVFAKEHLARATPAMMSTQEGPGRYRNHIPLRELLDLFTSRDVVLARSDRSGDASETAFTADDRGRWIDCRLRC